MINTIAKLFDKIINNLIQDYVDKNKILSYYKRVFEGGGMHWSSWTPFEDISTPQNTEYATNICFLDFEKAYDGVPHDQLFVKLISYKSKDDYLMQYEHYTIIQKLELRLKTPYLKNSHMNVVLDRNVPIATFL